MGTFTGVSDTANVKLGVCRIVFKGADLGYTKGGVEVEVSTDTHKVMVDQFGETEINEYIQSRRVVVRAPLAETTLQNWQSIMPGASSSGTVSPSAAAASGTITFTANPTDGDSIVLNGVTWTFKDTPVGSTDVQIGIDLDTTMGSLTTDTNASVDALMAVATYSDDSVDTFTVTYDTNGGAGNAYTLASNEANAVVSGNYLTGGWDTAVDGTMEKVTVESAIGTDLLAGAGELRLHPVALPDWDEREDFVVPLANTAGAASFAFKYDEERIFNVEFSGYPHATTKELFYIGDDAA